MSRLQHAAATAWIVLLADVSAALAQAPAAELPPDALARLEATRIEAIRVDGSTVFTPAELAAMTAPYEARVVSFEELSVLRETLSRAYLDRGYVNSGVTIPDQRVVDGVVVLQAVEGELSTLTVRGQRRWRDRAIVRRVRRDVSAPLNIAALQASLRRLEEDPLIARVNAELLPGEALGRSELRLGITETPPLELVVTAGNDRSPSVGEDHGTLALAYRGLIGNGDVLRGRFGFTEGVADNLLAYRVPITARGAALEVSVAEQDTDIVEAPFDRIDIASTLESWGISATLPLVRGERNGLAGVFGLEHRRSESTLLGLPFSFSPGDVDGRARGSSASAGLEWTHRESLRAWSLRGTVQIGIDAFDATRHAAAPDSDFVAAIGQFELVRTFAARGSRLLARSLLQIAQDPLLAMYKLPVGGRYTVRGYRENQFVRDNALVGSIEYQLPPVRDAAGQPRGRVLLAAFADYGVAWDEDGSLATSRRDAIASVGVGVLWDPAPGLHAELYYGFDLDDQHNRGSTLQDRGLHYALRFERRF